MGRPGKLHDNFPHRHLSHLYPAAPGFEANDDAALSMACRAALEMRMQNGLLQRNGWSLGHAVNVAARLKDSALVHLLHSELATNFVKPGLLTTLSPNDTVWNWFQVDANLGFTAAVMEALVFSRPGVVELLLALPRQWTKGQIAGVRCRGGVTVELAWDLTAGWADATLWSATAQRITLRLPYAIQEIELNAHETHPVRFAVA